MRENELKNYEEDEEPIFNPILSDLFNLPVFKREEKNFSKIMKTDIKETENGYVLDIEMPGVDKKDINLELKNGYLTISAERKTVEEEKDKKGAFIRRERHYGSASRSFFVGKDVREEDISASLDKGVLNIFVPRKVQKPEEHKKIEIK